MHVEISIFRFCLAISRHIRITQFRRTYPSVIRFAGVFLARNHRTDRSYDQVMRFRPGATQIYWCTPGPRAWGGVERSICAIMQVKLCSGQVFAVTKRRISVLACRLSGRFDSGGGAELHSTSGAPLEWRPR